MEPTHLFGLVEAEEKQIMKKNIRIQRKLLRDSTSLDLPTKHKKCYYTNTYQNYSQQISD